MVHQICLSLYEFIQPHLTYLLLVVSLCKVYLESKSYLFMNIHTYMYLVLFFCMYQWKIGSGLRIRFSIGVGRWWWLGAGAL
jgi:hypothetical protein